MLLLPPTRFVLKGFAKDGRDLTDKETISFLKAADKDGDGKIGVDGKHLYKTNFISGNVRRSQEQNVPQLWSMIIYDLVCRWFTVLSCGVKHHNRHKLLCSAGLYCSLGLLFVI